MIKVFREEVLLSTDMYNKIEEFFHDKSKKFKMYKYVSIENEDDVFNFRIDIGILDENIIISINTDGKTTLIKREPIIKSGNNINQIMGIICCKYKSAIKDDTYYFYFNINKIFDNEYDYYNEKRNRLDSYSFEDMQKATHFEIIYADFQNEKELALATYCMLVNFEGILSNDLSFKLYKNKLDYIDIELEDYSDKWDGYTMFNIDEILKEISKEDILNLMISCVAFFEKNVPLYKNDIYIMGFKMYYSYVKLLNN